MTTSSDTALRDLVIQDQAHHLHPKTNPSELARVGPTMIARAEGVYLYREDGSQVLDGMSGGWCASLGYGNERLCRAAYDAMRQLSYTLTFDGRTNPWAAGLSHKLAAITPEQYNRFFFASTGSDAVESALKMALYYWQLRDQPQKRIVIGRDLGYHGHTLFVAHLEGADEHERDFGFPLTGLVDRVGPPYWYRFGRDRSPAEFAIEAARLLERRIEELGPENVAAFIGEPVQATLGLIIPPEGYWEEVQRICDRYDILLLCDEVVTGMGKTGHMFGFERYGFEPDLFTLAKGFSSGYFPMSCVAVGAKVDRALQESDRMFNHGFTNSGHPVGAAVALETIAVLEDEGLVEKVRQETGPYLARRLDELREFPFVGTVDSVGIICSIEIDKSRIDPGANLADSEALGNSIAEIAWSMGLNARPVGTTFGMMFPLTITTDQVDLALDILKAAFAEALGRLGA